MIFCSFSHQHLYFTESVVFIWKWKCATFIISGNQIVTGSTGDARRRKLFKFWPNVGRRAVRLESKYQFNRSVVSLKIIISAQPYFFGQPIVGWGIHLKSHTSGRLLIIYINSSQNHVCHLNRGMHEARNTLSGIRFGSFSGSQKSTTIQAATG